MFNPADLKEISREEAREYWFTDIDCPAEKVCCDWNFSTKFRPDLNKEFTPQELIKKLKQEKSPIINIDRKIGKIYKYELAHTFIHKFVHLLLKEISLMSESQLEWLEDTAIKYTGNKKNPQTRERTIVEFVQRNYKEFIKGISCDSLLWESVFSKELSTIAALLVEKRLFAPAWY